MSEFNGWPKIPPTNTPRLTELMIGDYYMLRVRFLAFLMATSLLASSSISAAQERTILAVMDIQDNSGKLESSDVRTANDFLRGLLLKSGRFDVVDKSRHEAKRREVIEELRRESGDSCYDERCRIQLGRELAADTLLECTIGAMGTTCTFTCELIPLEKGTAESSGVAEFICGAKGLVGAVRTVSSQLTGADVDSVGSPPQRGAFVERNFGEEASSWQPIADVGVVTAFESQPDGATVVVDGQVQCQSTPCSRTLVRGRHHVSMLRENYVKVSRQIDVTPESRRIEFKLEPDFGWLTIQCAVPGVQVEMDGQPIGKTPLANYPAARGGHRIVLKDPRFLLRGKDVQIERGENEVVELEAVPRRGGLRIVATDSDGNDLAAQAFVDGFDLGATPVVAKAVVGSHRIVVEYLGRRWEGEAIVAENKTAEVHARISTRPAPNRKVGRRVSGEPLDSSLWGRRGSKKQVDRKKDFAKDAVSLKIALQIALGFEALLDDQHADSAGLFPIRIGILLDNWFQFALFADLAFVLNPDAPESNGGGVDAASTYSGLYGGSVAVWLPTEDSNPSFYVEALMGVSHVNDRCTSWSKYETNCEAFEPWNPGGSNTSWGTGIRLGMGFKSSGDRGVRFLVGGAARYQPVFGASLGAFIGLPVSW